MTYRDSEQNTAKVVFDKLFSPGILYNSIKSGLAVDYPIVTDPSTMNRTVFGTDQLDTSLHSYALTITNATSSAQDGEGYDGGLYWNKRIPFEAIVEPNNYLDVDQFYSQEPHPSGNLSASATWDGQGDELYTKMANNFMAEVPSFFLPNGQLTSIVSKKQEDITLTAGAVYGMRVKMRRTMDSGRGKVYHYATSSLPYYPPQDVNSGSANVRENFTMYSRPSSFGPPVFAGSCAGVRGV